MSFSSLLKSSWSILNSAGELVERIEGLMKELGECHMVPQMVQCCGSLVPWFGLNKTGRSQTRHSNDFNEPWMRLSLKIGLVILAGLVLSGDLTRWACEE